MAKDPAFLFYPGDWSLGTMHLTLLQKGCYMELLVLQFAKDKFTEAQAKHMLGSSFDLAWPSLREKFRTDGTYYWNERLKLEKEKRKKFTDSRRNNGSIRKSVKKNYEHMVEHMEDENENLDAGCLKGGTGGWNYRPGENEINLELPEIKIGAIIELFRITKQTDITEQEIISLWGVFKKQNFDGEKHYQSESKVYSHFINWCKTQNLEKNGAAHKQNIIGTKLGTSDARIKAAKNW
jgi:hypothetical protein